MKDALETVKILAAYDLTQSLRSAAELAGCSHHTVGRLVQARDAGRAPGAVAERGRVTDAWLPKIEEWVEKSKGRIRAECCPCQARRDGILGIGALNPPRGLPGQGSLPPREQAGPPSLGHRAGGLAPVRFRRRARHRRSQDGPVRRVAGLVQVPHRDPAA